MLQKSLNNTVLFIKFIKILKLKYINCDDESCENIFIYVQLIISGGLFEHNRKKRE